MPQLDGKVAAVTGAASGNGRATAEALAAAGAHVVAVDVSETGAGEVAEALGGTAVAGDVSAPDTWAAVIAATDALGGLDVVHLNAGLYGYTGSIEDLPDDVYERVMAANVGGVVLGTRATVPALRRRGGGAIVATASMAGLVPFAPNPLYTATKHAVTGFVRAMAPTLAADRITINAVCPGIVDTPMTVGAAGGIDPTELGIPLIPPSKIAAIVLDFVARTDTGRCVAIWAESDPVEWQFAGPDQLLR
jgi:NAD(P)-dependent dehydrogenase (short-subunit alcohol dehydrogenase family)